jgi:hypothetical protein
MRLDPTLHRPPSFVRRRRFGSLALVLLLGGASRLPAHDLFFRAPRYSFEPGARVVVDVLNGTFSRSENAITRDRLAELVVAGPAARRILELERWTEAEPKSTVLVDFEGPGTYVLGATVRPRLLKLSGREFNAYLKEEGLEDALRARRAKGRLEEPSRERYSKHLKAYFQVGTPSPEAPAPLGHGAEILPDQNPGPLRPGDRLTVRCLVDGQPWAGKVVGSGDRRFPQQRLVTDADGRATVLLTGPGVWYVKMVALREVSDAEANYESKWATLSFGVRGADGAEPR